MLENFLYIPAEHYWRADFGGECQPLLELCDDIHAHEVDTTNYNVFILIYKFLFQLGYKAA